MSIIIFIAISLLSFICKILNLKYNNSLSVSIGGGYILFILIGYLISHYELSINQRKCIYFLAIFGFLMYILGTNFSSFSQGKIIQTFKGYMNVPSVLYSTGVFTFFKVIIMA